MTEKIHHMSSFVAAARHVSVKTVPCMCVGRGQSDDLKTQDFYKTVIFSLMIHYSKIMSFFSGNLYLINFV